MSQIKHCSVRLPAELHRLSKLEAYKNAMTLQEWIACVIKNELKINNTTQS